MTAVRKNGSGAGCLERAAFTLPALMFLLLGLTACSTIHLAAGISADAKTNKILFQDDFTDPSSGWLTANEKDQIMGYDNGRFRMWINQSNFDSWSIPHLKFTDVQIEVDAANLDGPVNNHLGIICRYTDPGNFYGFLISSDGYYGISKRQDGNYQVLGMDEMKFSPLIQQGATTNHIQADCNGDTLALYVNGTLLAEAEDSSYASGDVGLLAGSYQQPGVDVIFDNFMVKSP